MHVTLTVQEKMQDAAEEAETSHRRGKSSRVYDDDPMDGRSKDESRKKDKYRDDGRRDRTEREGGRRDKERDDRGYNSRDRERTGKRESRGDRKSSMGLDDRDHKVS
jgi:hypothetical protein